MHAHLTAIPAAEGKLTVPRTPTDMEIALSNTDTSSYGWTLKGYDRLGEVIMARWKSGVESGFGRTGKRGCMGVDGPGEEVCELMLAALEVGSVRVVVHGRDVAGAPPVARLHG